MSNLYTHQWNPFTPTPPRPLTPGTAGYGAATWTDYAPPAAWAGAGTGFGMSLAIPPVTIDPALLATPIEWSQPVTGAPPGPPAQRVAEWHPDDIAKRQQAFRMAMGAVGGLLAVLGLTKWKRPGAAKWIQLGGGGALLAATASPMLSNVIEHRLSARSRVERVDVSAAMPRKEPLQLLLGQYPF